MCISQLVGLCVCVCGCVRACVRAWVGGWVGGCVGACGWVRACVSGWVGVCVCVCVWCVFVCVFRDDVLFHLSSTVFPLFFWIDRVKSIEFTYFRSISSCVLCSGIVVLKPVLKFVELTRGLRIELNRIIFTDTRWKLIASR